MKIKVYENIGEYGLTRGEAFVIKFMINSALTNGDIVELDFEKVKFVSATWVAEIMTNVKMDKEYIREHIKLINANENIKNIMNYTISMILKMEGKNMNKMDKKEIREQVKRKLQKSINAHIQKIYNEIDRINEELQQSNELCLIYQALANAGKDKTNKKIYEDKLRQYQELQKLLHEKKDMLFAIAHEMTLVTINFKKE